MRILTFSPILAILLSVTPFLSFSQIHISGPLSGVLVDTTYIVDGDISVEVGDSLVIEAGADLLFDDLSSFWIFGYLLAQGSNDDSITFLPLEPEVRWSGIRFENSVDNSTMSYSVICGSIDGGIEVINSQLQIENSFICNNRTDSSGVGIYVLNGDISITNSEISYNQGGDDEFGGGLAAYDSNINLFNCNLDYNQISHGGGAFIENSQLTAENCSFSNNIISGSGGGVFVLQSSCDFINCRLNNNYIEAYGTPLGHLGGGMYCAGSGVINIDKCEFINNTAYGRGGGLCRYWGPGIPALYINETLFKDNEVSYNNGGLGGGLSSAYSLPVELVRCLFINNSTNGEGGAIHSMGANNWVENCLFYDNQSGDEGGAVFLGNDSYFLNNIVMNNSGSPTLYTYQLENISVSYNNFFGNSGNLLPAGHTRIGEISQVNANGDSCDVFGNIFLNPLFQSITGDSAFRLRVDSPCIDAGNPESPLDPDSTIADIGAYYYNHNTWVKPGTESNAPSKFALYPTYPNPFNQTSVVRYQLSADGLVSLSVYDITGREVVKLVDGFRVKGSHEVKFEGKDLASGVYFVKLEAGNLKAVKKALLVK